jgi:exonuclease VII large subunit
MSSSALSITVIAAVLFGATACKDAQIERKAEDVRDAQEDLQDQRQQSKENVREEQQDLENQQAELQAAVQNQLNDAQRRFNELSGQADVALGRVDAASPLGSEIEQQRTLARTKLDLARTSQSPEETQQALRDARDALDKLENRLKEIDTNSGS